RNFVDYFNRVPMFSQFSLSNLKLNSYRLLEKAELEILRVLSELTVQRIPVIRGEDIEHMEILKTYPYKHTFSYGDKTLYIHENEAYHMHSASTEVINWMKPLVLKCCRNCVFFQYSGMSLDMSGGNAGYCKLPLNQTAESIVTNIWNWCDKFERNVKI
ncbi:MAG TPA: hypothetical protein PK228_20475, partial [Saprospiraceae bacterium]|nr:hypothetical protein [Saprospiraceae bacterium]